MMRVVDTSGVVHVAESQPAREGGDTFAGLTRCDRWWAWATTNVIDDNILLMNYSTGAPTCLACANERRAH